MTDNSRVRVSIVGVVIVALFIALLARLWFLQMGPEEQLRFQAVARSTRVVQTESPRGRILDRNGNVLVENVAEWAVTVDRTLDKDTRPESSVSSPRRSRRSTRPSSWNRTSTTCARPRSSPRSWPWVYPKRPASPSSSTSRTIRGRRSRSSRCGTIRRALASHLLGYVGEISDEQLATVATPATKRARRSARTAPSACSKDLRGKPRREKVEVDPTGQPVGAPLDVDPGTIGNDVTLTIDASWQGAAELALAQGIESRASNRTRTSRTSASRT